MKNSFKTIIVCFVMLSCASWVSAQTADEVIAKYIQAIGGKELISKITSVYYETKLNVMDNETVQKTTLLNGKGFKQEMDMMGSAMVTCITDKGGWMINPFMGGTGATDMPEAQYKTNMDQIYVGGILSVYADKGYKAELDGNAAVDNINAVKVKLTAPDNTSSAYFFDPATGYLVRIVQQIDMQGQPADNTITLSDYKQVEGYSMPYGMKLNVGGQFELTGTITKAELNKAVDPAIFAKPQ